jgi:hypothetical protein
MADLILISCVRAKSKNRPSQFSRSSAKVLLKLENDHERSRNEINGAKKTGTSEARQRSFLQKQSCEGHGSVIFAERADSDWDEH